MTTLRQQTNESVDAYANKFKQLASRINLQDANQKKRMFLMGLNPAYTAIVYSQNPGDLDAAIAAARNVEIGFNYASGTSSKAITATPSSSKPINDEVDELSRKLEQLTINYANLTSALVAQTEHQTRSFPAASKGRPRYNTKERNGPIICYNCDKPGHISRECPHKRRPRRPRFEDTRDLHYVDYDSEGFSEEYETEEEDEYEVYVNTRASFYPKNPESKNRRFTKRSESNREETLRTPAYVPPVELPEEEMPDATPKTTTTKKPKRRLLPAPIEQLTEFNVANYLSQLPCGLSVGQAAHEIPKYRSGLIKAVRRTREKDPKDSREANLADSDGELTSAAKCTLRVARQAVTAIIDSGAATCIITKPLLDKLGYNINRNSKMLVLTANGAKAKSLGIVDNVEILIGSIRVLTSFQVLESKDSILILGNDWLRNNNAMLDWNKEILTLRQNGRSMKVPVQFTKASKMTIREEEYESEDESDYEEFFDEFAIYYSDSIDSSSDEGSLDYNPWADAHSPDYTKNTQEIHLNTPASIVTEEEPEEELECETTNPATFIAELMTSQTEEEKPPVGLGPLDYHQQQTFHQLLADYSDICAQSQTQIGKTTAIKHKINTGNSLPIAQKPYRTNPENAKFLNEEIKKMLENGIIRPSKSPWASPVVIVGKKGGDKQLCVDYRKLNKLTEENRYPLPRIDDLLDSLGGATWFSTMDLASGFWQVQMAKEDIKKTTFITANGLYEFTVMPFGLNNAPSTFQRLMNWVLRDYLGKFVAVYLDDVIIYTNGSFELHIDHIKQVFQTLRENLLKIKLKKCHFCHPSLAFLGHIVGRGGITPDPEKIEKAKNFPAPKTLTQLRAALGLLGYYRKFIKDFSRHAKPLTMLLKKDQPFVWTEKQQNAFDRLKARLIEEPILRYPDFNLPFILFTDASKTGLGAVLSQKKDGKEYVVAYASRTTNKAEENYPITDLECLAIVWAVKHFHHYLSQPFTVVTDHAALKWLQTYKNPKGRRARWIMDLQQYKFTIEHRSGKSNSNADALSRMHEGENESENEEYMIETFFADVNNSEEATGWGEADPADENLWQQSQYLSDDEWHFSEPSERDNWENSYSSDSEKSNDTEDFPVPFSREEAEERYPFLFRRTYENIPIGYSYCPGELESLYSQNIRIRQVIAGQPYTRGNGQCDLSCDVENHHVHTYCTICKRNLPYGTTVHNNCYFKNEERCFVMNPRVIINKIWWTEPSAVQIENNRIYLKYLQKLLDGRQFYEDISAIHIADLD